MATRQQTLGMTAVIAMAFAISTFTAFRFESVPLGLSELIIVACLIAHLPLGFGVHGGNTPNRLVPFVTVLVFATLPGYVVTLSVDGSYAMAHHGLMSSVYILVLFTWLHFGFDHKVFSLDRLGQMFVVFSSVYFGVVIALAWLDPAAVYAQDQIEDLILRANQGEEDIELAIRLVGFSTNPNQLGLHALVVAFFALRLRRALGNVGFLVCFGAAVGAGLMSKSDAFLFAIIALLGSAIFMGVVFRGSVIGGIALVLPAVVIGILVLDPVVEQIQEIVSTKDQNLTRFTLWENGIEAGLDRPLLGLGPGAWSGYEGPKELEEAHNTAIDHFAIGGLLGLFVLLIGTAAMVLRTLLARDAVLLGGVLALIVFATFHYVLRQPVIWLLIYYVVQQAWPAGVRSRRRPARGKRVYRAPGDPRRGRRRRDTGAGLPV